MTLLSILALGFFLEMRHATDSDHVIAVTTIVSRQRKVGSAALTGIYWGIGHSIMLLAAVFHWQGKSHAFETNAPKSEGRGVA
jgi:high-affinity nickel permease